MNGYDWVMRNILPDQAGLTVGGITYSYDVFKNPQDDFKVHNEIDDLSGNNLFRETDDWSGLPGNSIQKSVTINDLPIHVLGDGRIRTEGEGQISDPNVSYLYTYDPCFDPMSLPTCDGYHDALYDFLLANGLLDDEEIYDPLSDDNVLSVLEAKVEKEDEEEDEEEKEEEEEETEESLEDMLSISDEANSIADAAAQQTMLQALAQVQKLDTYAQKVIDGGVYKEVVSLKDKKISDNKNVALRMGLASDRRHEEMVSSQYNKE